MIEGSTRKGKREGGRGGYRETEGGEGAGCGYWARVGREGGGG